VLRCETIPMSKKRIFIVDDHPLVREWLSVLINQEEDLMVCGVAEDSQQARKEAAVMEPDLAVVDITLGDDSGLELIGDLKALHPGMAIIVLSMHRESLYAERVQRAGAMGYVMKKESTTSIIEAIRCVLEGKTWFGGKKDSKPDSGTREAVKQLSDRELEVFRLLGKGYETRRIAGQLQLSINTIQVYCARIKEKMNLANATELLREAVRWEEGAGRRGG